MECPCARCVRRHELRVRGVRGRGDRAGPGCDPALGPYHSERRPAEFRRLLLQSLGVGVAAGVGTVLGVALLGRPVLKLVYGPAFAGHLDVFLVLAVAGGLGYARTFLGHAVTAARWFAIQPLVAVSGLTTTVVLAWLLVPRGGMMGAALAVLGGSVVQTMGMGSVASGYLGRSPGHRSRSPAPRHRDHLGSGQRPDAEGTMKQRIKQLYFGLSGAVRWCGCQSPPSPRARHGPSSSSGSIAQAPPCSGTCSTATRTSPVPPRQTSWPPWLRWSIRSFTGLGSRPWDSKATTSG